MKENGKDKEIGQETREADQLPGYNCGIDRHRRFTRGASSLVVWLIMPMAGQRAVPRKSRSLKQSWLEWPVNAVQIEFTAEIGKPNLLNDPQEVSSQNGRRNNNGPS